MSRRSWFTVGWLVWLASFVALEGVALFNHTDGDTLSEHVWSWFHVTDPHAGPLWIGSRVVLAAFLIWLLFHFTFAWFTPSHPLPREVAMTQPLSTRRDAWVRAVRTFVQGLWVDVLAAVLGALTLALSDVHWTKAWGVALVALLVKTAATAATSYVYRHLKPPPAQ
jgi:hypothetical protein